MPLQSVALFESPLLEAALRRSGLASLNTIFRAGTGSHVRHVGRSVWKTELRGDDDEPFSVFIKLSWGRRRWWPRMTDVRSGQVFDSLAMREWKGLAQLSRLGLNVPQRLALFEDGLLWKRSALIIREIPAPASISDMLCDGTWKQLSDSERHSLLKSVVAAFAPIHTAGFGWRGTSSRHVYPLRNAAAGWDVWLIDCEGVHPARSSSVVDRDFDKLERSLRADGADGTMLAILRELRSASGGISSSLSHQPDRGQRCAA
jgi:hypothetical protein